MTTFYKVGSFSCGEGAVLTRNLVHDMWSEMEGELSNVFHGTTQLKSSFPPGLRLA